MLTIPIPDGASRVQPKVVSWFYAAFLLAPDGSLWGWGDNSHSRLLAPKAPNERWPRPRRLGTNSDWIDLAVMHNAVVLLRREWTLWSWDASGTNGSPDAPRLLSTNAGWRSIQNGISHVLALQEDGSLWAWGQNNCGQVGDGTTNNHTAPVPIGTNRNWRVLAPGAFHSLAVQSNGTLWYWGRIDSHQPVTITPTNTLEPVQFGVETNWLAVVSGDYHTLAQKTDGSLWLMGPNTPSMTGQNNNPSNAMVRFEAMGGIRQLAAGGMHCLALRDDGSVWGFGRDYNGSLARSSANGEPAHIGTRRDWAGVWSGSASFALAADGTLWAWGTKLGEPNRLGFFERIHHGIGQLAGMFGKGGGGGRAFGGVPPHTAVPWPIAKFVTNGVATAAENNKLERTKLEN